MGHLRERQTRYRLRLLLELHHEDELRVGHAAVLVHVQLLNHGLGLLHLHKNNKLHCQKYFLSLLDRPGILN